MVSEILLVGLLLKLNSCGRWLTTLRGKDLRLLGEERVTEILYTCHRYAGPRCGKRAELKWWIIGPEGSSVSTSIKLRDMAFSPSVN